jgi:PAS domain S-box-containing protein
MSTQGALRESEERLQMAMAGGQMGMWDFLLSSNRVLWSEKQTELWGFALPDQDGNAQAVFDAIHPADRQRVERECVGAAEGQSEVFESEFRVVHPDGSVRWLVGVGSRIGDGDRTRLVGVNFDVTDRKRSEQALRESEERFRTLADNMSQFAWMADAQGSIFWFNKRWYDYTGTTLEQVQGWGWKRVHHPDHLDRVVARLQQSWETGQPWEDTFPLRGRDGTYRWFLSRALPIRDSNGKIVRWFGTNTDVTERKALEEELRQTADQLARANRRKNEFLANISHEIRSPMTAILGYLDLLDVRSEEDQRSIETIRRNGDFLLGLINDILDLSKIESGRFEVNKIEFSLTDVVADVIELMRNRAEEKGLRLEATYATALPETVISDAVRVRQILINLVGNAIKFTEQGSVRLVVSCDPAAGELRCQVIDTGIGVDSSEVARLFKPFEQADGSVARQFGGTGLGLAICQRLAKVLTGRIDVTSQLGAGSVFTLVLPVPRDVPLVGVSRAETLPAGPAEAAAKRSAETEQLGLRVLVVDDRQDLRFLLRRILEKAGCVVTTCDNGEAALCTIDEQERDQAPFDAVIMDMQMPKVDGLTAVRQLKAEGYARPIIALTANARSSDREACLRAGYTDYLSKPIDRTLLLEKLKRCTAQ